MNNLSGNANWNIDTQKPETIINDIKDEKEIEKISKNIEKSIKNIKTSYKTLIENVDELYELKHKKEYYDILITLRTINNSISSLN